MQRVCSGIPDAKTIKELFDKTSKRVYLYLKSDTQVPSQHSISVANVASGSGCSSGSVPLAIQSNPTPPMTQPNPTPPVAQPNPTPPMTQPNPVPPVAQPNPTPPMTQPNPAPPVAQPHLTPSVFQPNPVPTMTQSNPVPPVAQPNPVPPVAQPNPVPPVAQSNPVPPVAQPNPVPPVAQPNPVPPVAQPNPVPTMTQSNPVPPVAQPNPVPPVAQPNPVPPVAQPNPVPPVPQPAPTHRGTRQGSSALRRTIGYSDTHQPLGPVHVESDNDDNDLLHSPFDISIVEIEPDHPGSAFNEAPETCTAGVLEEDVSPIGITDVTKGKVPLSKIDRVQEVILCEKELMDGNVYKPLPVLLNLSFDEMCQQGKADECMMVCVVLKEGDDLNPVRRFLSLLGNANEVYFWIAKSGTKSARQVTDKFGSNSQKTEIFVLAPTSARPVLVERYSGETLRNVQQRELENAIGEGKTSLEGLRNERERKNMRKEQDEEYQKSLLNDRKNAEQDTGVDASDVSDQGNRQPMDVDNSQCNSQEKEEEIRKVRSLRVNEEEPTQGTTVRVRTPNGNISRMFGLGSHYQEVYDWVGSQENMPLHFTLHRGDVVVLHQDRIVGDETVNLTERDKQEVTKLLFDQVSFKGNYPGNKDLSDTLVDEGRQKSGAANVENEEKEKKEKKEREEEKNIKDGDEKKKRKRKDNRTSKDRRKKQKD